MKKVLYICLILLILFFTLPFLIRKDTGENTVLKVSELRPLDIPSFNFPPAGTKTIDGVDYLVSRGEIGKFGGDFVASSIGEGPKTFNPFNSNDATSSSISGLMYDGLLNVDAFTGEVIPRLAKSFEILSDGKTYIINLRKGIKWSDGTEITADDVYFTYNTIIFGGYGDTSTRDSMYVSGKLPRIEKIDKYTVKFITPVPFAPFIRSLTTPIAPRHIFKFATDKGKEYFRTFMSTDYDVKKFVVSGPFKISEYIPAQRVVYEKNPNFYIIDKNNNRLPYLNRYIILIVGDLNNDIIKFEAKETDTTTIPGSMVSKYREDEKKSDYIIYNLGPTSNTNFIAFNMNSRKNKQTNKFYIDPIKQNWFRDKNFRSAVDYAIDRESLVLNVLSGVGEPLYTAEGIPSMFLNKKLAKGHAIDIEKAKKLLLESGFYLKDGLLYDKFGNKVEFELLTNAGNTQREATGVSIKEDLSKLGITVNFKPIEFNSLVNKLTNSLDWESVIMGLTANPFEPHSGYNVWNSNGALHVFNQRSENDMGGDNLLSFEKELNEIYDAAAIEVDSKKRHLLYDRYQEIVAENNPFIYLYSPLNVVVVRKKFKNIYPTPFGGVTHNIEEIYLDE